MKFTEKEIESIETLFAAEWKPADIVFNDVTFSQQGASIELVCKPTMFQTLRDAGVSLDFYNTYLFNGRTVLINARMNYKVFRWFNGICRSATTTKRMELLNDFELSAAGVLKPRKLWASKTADLPQTVRKAATRLRQRIINNCGHKSLQVNKYVWLRLEDKRYITEVLHAGYPEVHLRNKSPIR